MTLSVKYRLKCHNPFMRLGASKIKFTHIVNISNIGYKSEIHEPAAENYMNIYLVLERVKNQGVREFSIRKFNCLNRNITRSIR